MAIKDSRISYQDMVANGVNLKIGRVAAGATTPVGRKIELLGQLEGGRALAARQEFDEAKRRAET